MTDHDWEPPSGRRGGSLAVTIIAALLLAISALAQTLLTYQSIEMLHKVTCEPHGPPVAQRAIVAAVGLGLYLAVTVPAVRLLIRGRSNGAAIALALAIVSLTLPFVELIATVFTTAMC